MEPKWNRNRTELVKMRKMKIILWKPCTKTLVSRSKNQNREPEPRYQNRYCETTGAEVSVPKPRLNWKISTVPTLLNIIPNFCSTLQDRNIHGTEFNLGTWLRENKLKNCTSTLDLSLNCWKVWLPALLWWVSFRYPLNISALDNIIL